MSADRPTADPPPEAPPAAAVPTVELSDRGRESLDILNALFDDAEADAPRIDD